MALQGLTMGEPLCDGIGPEEDCMSLPPGLADEGALRMCRIWEDALGTGPVEPDDDYFALGGDSLQAIEIFTEIQKVFGPRLPLSALYNAPTPAQLTALAYEGIDPDSSPLFRLSHSGEGPPLFLLPGAGANAFVFDNLLKTADLRRPVYGFRLASVGSGGGTFSSLVEMAGRFVEHVVAVQPDGPYYLGGYSFGGRLAFEMARQLDAAGSRVAFLGLIDTYCPGYPPYMPLLRRIRSHLRAATHPDRQRRRKYIRDRLARARERVKGLTRKVRTPPCSDCFPVPDYVRDDFHYHRWLSLQYVPAAYAGRLTVFRASDVPQVIGTDFSDPCLGWGRFATGDIEVRPVPGNHLSLLREPHVGALARSLKACLDR
jgi:oxalate---CoA ligase